MGLTGQVCLSSAEVEFDGFYLGQVAMLRVLARVTVGPETQGQHGSSNHSHSHTHTHTHTLTHCALTTRLRGPHQDVPDRAGLHKTRLVFI